MLPQRSHHAKIDGRRFEAADATLAIGVQRMAQRNAIIRRLLK
jgi:hypothetical protein